MREVLSNFLASNAESDKNFYVLSGDHGYALFDEIRRKAPEQFINTGVTEQAMVGLSAGMAKTGKRVVIYGLACFVPIRVLEFIKINICYENLPIIILGDGAGTIYTTLGASHQTGEDIAAIRTLPVKIYSPCDKKEMQLCLEDAFKHNGPTYIRIGKSDKPAVHDFQKSIELKSFIFVGGNKNSTNAIFATGSMVSTGLELAKRYDCAVYSMPILKGFESSELVRELSRFQSIVTLEEHSIHGGLGTIISEIITDNGIGCKLSRQGITKYYTKGVGTYDYAIKYHELDVESLSKKLSDFLN